MIVLNVCVSFERSKDVIMGLQLLNDWPLFMRSLGPPKGGLDKIFAKSETSPNTRKDPPKKIHLLKNQVLLKHNYVIFLKDLTKPRINSNTFTVDSLEFIVRDGLAVSVYFHLC